MIKITISNDSLKYKAIAISVDVSKMIDITIHVTINKMLLVPSKYGHTVERSVPRRVISWS